MASATTKGRNTKASAALSEPEAVLKETHMLENTVDIGPVGDVDAAKTLGVDNADEIFDRERQLIADKLVSNVPVPVPFNKLIWADNVRSTRTLGLDSMVRSIKQKGFLSKYPIVVSKKHDGKMLVLCGNRRTGALQVIHDAEPGIFKATLPDGNIPALVFENLTETDEILLRNDHAEDEDRIPLDDEGMFYSIRQMVKAGLGDSQAQIAAKLGLMKMNPSTKRMEPNRSLVQQRVNLAKLPAVIQSEFIKLMAEGKNATTVRWQMVQGLYSAYAEERKAGFVKEWGPKLTKLWSEALTPKAAGGTTPEGGKMLTKTEAEKVSENLGSRFGQLLMLKVTGNDVKDTETGNSLDWSAIDGQLIQAEEAQSTLTEIAEYMGKTKFAHMMRDIQKARLAKAKAEAATPAK